MATLSSDELKKDLDKMEHGGIFREYHLIRNLLEGDFFSWYLNAWNGQIEEALRELIQKLDDYDPTTLGANPKESRDLLKKLYHKVMPRNIRHNLGEYYTPDWLAQRLLNQVNIAFFTDDPAKSSYLRENLLKLRFLDPACGSGTFLALIISRIREAGKQLQLPEEAVLNAILRNVVGIDLNPLAVITARTTYVLALGELLDNPKRKDIDIPVFLADSIVTPSKGEDLWSGGKYRLPTSVGEFWVPEEVIDRQRFDTLCELLDRGVRDEIKADTFLERCRSYLKLEEKAFDKAKPALAELYEKIYGLHKDHFNGIWARILRNGFAPLFVGKFDYVVGNPPYVRIQTLPREDADYYRAHYESAFGSFDVYVLFLEKAVRLLKLNGRLGFIASGKFLKVEYGKKIQQVLHENCTVEHIVDLSAQQVFGGATTYPAILVLRKGKSDDPLSYTFVPRNLVISNVTESVNWAALPFIKASQEAVIKGVWPPVPTMGDSLIEKLSALSTPLRDLAERLFVGLQTSADNIYILEKRAEPKDALVKVYSRALGQEYELETALLKPLLSGKNVQRYGCPLPDQLLLFPYKLIDGKAELILPSEFASLYPKCFEYLLQNRAALENRESGKMRHERWYAYVYPKNLALHDLRKMAIPRLVKRLASVYDQYGNFYLDNVDVGGLILKDDSEAHYSYILGLLNSRLLNLYFCRISAPFLGDFHSANRQFLEPLPIRRIDFANPAEKKLHDDLVLLVDRMLELNKRLAPIRTTPGNERDELQREIENTDRQIDNLVYDLYGLTEEERRVVEGEKQGK